MNRAAYFAEKLYRSMKGFGTRDITLIRILVSRCEVDLYSIMEAFKDLYDGVTLADWIQGDTSGAYRDILLRLVDGKKASARSGALLASSTTTRTRGQAQAMAPDAAHTGFAEPRAGLRGPCTADADDGDDEGLAHAPQPGVHLADWPKEETAL